MSKLTRRALFSLAGGAAALAACKPATKHGGRPDKLFGGEVQFQHGLAAGDPLPDRMMIWTRVTPLTGAGAVPVRYEVFREGESQPIRSDLAEALEARDYCIKVDVTGLEPATRYRYRFIAYTAAGDVMSPEGFASTTAATGDGAVRLAIVSCSNWQFGKFTAYRALAAEPDIDAIVHLGDYLYEYGLDGYGGDVAQKIGRIHDPAHEMVTLADYRRRHAQYKTDPDLQAAHAQCAWICTWDDHESSNDAWADGAENHDPDQGEGEWTKRKSAALQAYMEWMPIREPEPGQPASAVWRRFRFGDVAHLFALESRLTGRTEPLDWASVLQGQDKPDQVFASVQAAMQKVADPARSMLGAAQEKWLAEELGDSVKSGVAWQVLANQVIMARVALPKLRQTLSPAQIEAQKIPEVRMMIGFSDLGLPANLDAWDGYPAARGRLYAAAADAGARIVTLSGDTHTAFANHLHDARGARRGVEFGCTSITSPGSGSYVVDVPDLGEQFAAANEDVEWHDPFGHGYTLVTLTRDAVRAEFRKVSSILEDDYEITTATAFEARTQPGGVSALRRL